MSNHLLALSEQLQIRYLVCHRYDLNYNWHIPARQLPHDVLWLVDSGHIHYSLDQDRHLATSGDVLLLPQDTILTSRATSDHLTIFSLNINVHLTMLPHRRWHELFGLTNPLSADQDLVRKSLQTMANRASNSNIGTPLLQQADTLTLLAHLLLRIDQTDQSTERNRSEARVDAAIAYMQAHPRDWPSVEQLAQIADVSPSYLGKLFVQTIGLSTRQFLIHVKLSQAKAMLINSRMRITEIAEQLGYDSANYLGRQFKQATGMTPRAYRQSYSRWL